MTLALDKTVKDSRVEDSTVDAIITSDAQQPTQTSTIQFAKHRLQEPMQTAMPVQPTNAVTEPVHIVLVTETWYPDVNGVAMSLGHLMRELVQLGHTVSLIRPESKSQQGNALCCMSSLLKPNENVQSVCDADVNQVISKQICVRGVPIPRYSDMQFGMPQYRLIKRELADLQKNGRVDIVHIATEGPLGLATLTAAKRLKLPVTTGYHTQFHDFSKHFGMGVIAKPLLTYFKWFHNWSDATCVPSPKTQDDLSKLGFERINQVGRGVDTKHFNPAKRSDALRESWDVKPQYTVLIMVSRLSPEKGVDMVIDAFRALQTAQMHRATKLVIVGEGPDRARLEALAAPCGEDVIFTGTKMGTELAEHYASGDAFVFASQVETFGNVVTEAMASGLPVFAFDDAAAGMLVTDKTGALAPMGQKDAFIDMVAALPKMQRLNQQGIEARQAVEQFSWGRPAKQMLDMFYVAIAQHEASNKFANHTNNTTTNTNNKPSIKSSHDKSLVSQMP